MRGYINCEKVFRNMLKFLTLQDGSIIVKKDILSQTTMLPNCEKFIIVNPAKVTSGYLRCQVIKHI